MLMIPFPFWGGTCYISGAKVGVLCVRDITRILIRRKKVLQYCYRESPPMLLGKIIRRFMVFPLLFSAILSIFALR